LSNRNSFPPNHRRLSHELAELIVTFSERPVCLGDIVHVLQTRGYMFLLIVLTLPFCTPIPLPGVSIPFGVVISLIGYRLALRKAPWLPERILKTPLPPRFFPGLLGAGRHLMIFIERLLRPRWPRMINNRATHHLGGVVILISGGLMILPLPIPFTNSLPALTVALIASAFIEHDGLVALVSLFSLLVTLAYFWFLFWGGTEALEWLRAYFSGLHAAFW